MPVKIVKINSETLPAIADAIRAKTGSTGSILPSQMAGKIANIPTGGELPVLSSPATAGHVVSGKEYIDALGNKQTGTLVICDSVNNVETIGEAGIGVHAKIESTVDKSSDVLTLQDQNFKPENIKSGISIFGVAGSVKEIHTETGTITPAEDTQTITIPATGKVLDIVGVSVPAETGYVIAVSYSKGNYNTDAQIGGYFRYASPTAIISAGIGVSANDSQMVLDTNNAERIFAGGVTYRWTVYNWEDDV